MNSSDKVALITGSTHGIGKAIALKLARLKYSLVLNGASTVRLSESYESQLNEIFGNALEKFTYVKENEKTY